MILANLIVIRVVAVKKIVRAALRAKQIRAEVNLQRMAKAAPLVATSKISLKVVNKKISKTMKASIGSLSSTLDRGMRKIDSMSMIRVSP